jgi:hypothetical protein
VDPLVAYLPGDINANHDQGVRRALLELRNLAEATGVAVIAIRHLRKSGASSAVYRGAGSIGIIGAARNGMLVASDPDDPTRNRRVLACLKLNVAARPSSYAFHVAAQDGGAQPRIVWEGPSKWSADDLLQAAESPRVPGALEEAEEFLHALLSPGVAAAGGVWRAAKEAGISGATLRRAKVRLGVESLKTGRPGEPQSWHWRLSGNGDEAKVRPSEDREPLRVSEAGKPKCEHEEPEGAQPAQDGLSGPALTLSSPVPSGTDDEVRAPPGAAQLKANGQ